MKTKTCSACKNEKSVAEFFTSRRYADGYRSNCKACHTAANIRYRQTEAGKASWRRWYEKVSSNPAWKEKKAQQTRKSTHGISSVAYDGMLEAQGGKCAVCGGGARWKHGCLVVDHCHTTGVIRGLLCCSCNWAIGQLGDSYESIQRVAAYLKPLSAIALSATMLAGCAQQHWHWERQGATAGDFYQDRGQCNAQAFAVPGAGLLQIALVQNSCLQGKGWEKVSG